MEKLYKLAPNFFQNIMVTLYNYKAYKRRHGGEYKIFLDKFKANRNLSREALFNLQRLRYSDFINHAIENSRYYRERFKDIKNASNLDNIDKLPILDKEILRTKIDDVVIQTNEKLGTSKTGGTTGKALEVFTRASNTQERNAMLDDFRSRFGYKLGKRTAWFSGKNLLTSRDVNKDRFWKDDYLSNVRYYSTFHIKNDFLPHYINNIIHYKPEYLIGFPSTMWDIARFGLNNGFKFPSDTIKAVFPTAETITAEMRSDIETFFQTKIYDQYASSEGAPFIFECVEGNRHFELQSGVFEVLDQNNCPTNSGNLVVTSFTTEGTPLIRYNIGDAITLDDPKKTCACGNNNPMVLAILGRQDDYVYSPQNGKINIINIANTLKDAVGILSFQAVQNSLDAIDLYIIVDKNLYTKERENNFSKNWRDRIGENMKLSLHYVDEIPVEASGKFRLVKNNIKHLVNP